MEVKREAARRRSGGDGERRLRRLSAVLPDPEAGSGCQVRRSRCCRTTWVLQSCHPRTKYFHLQKTKREPVLVAVLKKKPKKQPKPNNPKPVEVHCIFVTDSLPSLETSQLGNAATSPG